jgi:hypothetical protein
MRGAIQYEDVLTTTYAERQIMSEFIEGRLKSESKRHSPVY